MKRNLKTDSLKRELNPMPRQVKQMLQAEGLWDAYMARPPYQRNDYLGWIARAKLQSTRDNRTRQMLDELKQGDVYMKMKWKQQ